MSFILFEVRTQTTLQGHVFDAVGVTVLKSKQLFASNVFSMAGVVNGKTLNSCQDVVEVRRARTQRIIDIFEHMSCFNTCPRLCLQTFELGQ